ncbi:hypothetical protein ABIE18_003153 [Arthrobacter sp. 2762]
MSVSVREESTSTPTVSTDREASARADEDAEIWPG